MDEFREIFPCDATELPEIDFSSCTLIIGMHAAPTNSHRVIEHSIIVGTKEMILNLFVEFPESNYPAGSQLYFWGLYSKLPKKSVNVNVIYKIM